ncbi:hypothetical protein ACFSTC_22180 [Nonomuraea ferruginea]
MNASAVLCEPLEVEGAFAEQDLLVDAELVPVAQQAGEHVAGQVLLTQLTGRVPGQQRPAALQRRPHERGVELVQRRPHLGPDDVRVPGGVHQGGAFGELLRVPVERVRLGRGAGGPVDAGDQRGQAHDRAVAELDQVRAAVGGERRQRVAYDVVQELALPVPERAPAEQPVLHPAPHAVVLPVQHQQAVGHDDPALVVERLLEVAQPEGLAYVGVAVKSDRRHRHALPD